MLMLRYNLSPLGSSVDDVAKEYTSGELGCETGLDVCVFHFTCITEERDENSNL